MDTLSVRQVPLANPAPVSSVIRELLRQVPVQSDS